MVLMDGLLGSLDHFTRRHLYNVFLDFWAEPCKTIVTLPPPHDEDVRASADAVTITKAILERLGITEEEATRP